MAYINNKKKEEQINKLNEEYNKLLDSIEGTKPQSENITIGKKFIRSEAYNEIDYQEAKAQSERVKTEIKNLLSLILKE